MEGAPSTNESSPDDKDKKDKKSSEKSSGSRTTLTAAPQEGSREKASVGVGEERDGLWRRLIGTERDAKPAAESKDSANASAQPEIDNPAAELPLESLSPDEEQLVARQLVQAEVAAAEDLPNKDAAPGIEAAVGRFRSRILEAGETPDQALMSTLEALDSDSLLSEAAAGAVAGVTEALEPDLGPHEFSSAEHIVELQPSDQAETPVSGPAGAWSRGGGGPLLPPTYDHLTPLADYLPSAAGVVGATVLSQPERGVGYDKSDVVGAALVGGIIGYLIGRRRGRIKTQKRLLPVQRKLEKQVKHLQQDIISKEFTIRQAAEDYARERRQADGALARKVRTLSSREARIARAERGGVPRHVAEYAATVDALAGTPEAARQFREAAVRTGAVTAAEASAAVLAAGGGAAEGALAGLPDQERQQIGHVLMNATETLPVGLAEVTAAAALIAPQRARTGGSGESLAGDQSVPAAEKAPPVELDKHVATLSQKDLLELSGKIVVEGTNLRQAYESHQIGEKALRRIVGEHLRGGDIRQALRAELVQHEIDFERDPQMRDRAHQVGGGGSGKALSAILQQADAVIGAPTGDERAVLEAREAYHLKEQSQAQRQQHLINVSLVSIIAVLIGLVIILVVTRG